VTGVPAGSYSAALGSAFARLPAGSRAGAPFVAGLAAIELLARLNRRLSVSVASGPVRIGLGGWPDEVRHGGGSDARERLSPYASPLAELPSGPHLAVALALGDEPAPPDAPGGAGVRLLCRIDGAALRVGLRCPDDDPWRRPAPAVAEIFAELLGELLSDPARPAREARGIGAASRAVVLGALAGGAVDNGPFRAIPHAIEDVTDRHPERPALTYGGRTLTYRALDELANALAALLAARGVGKGDVTPVVMVNGLEMPLAYQALMKLGAAFVPYDPAWPADRIAATLGALAPKVVLCTDPATIPPPWRERALRVALDELTPRAQRPRVALGPDDAIYGIFTSGTTGLPKCALNLHAGLANRFAYMTRYFRAGGGAVVLQNSKHTFDSAVWQLFWPLTTGARTVIPAQGEFLNLDHTIDTIAAHGITMTDFVPSIFNMLVSIVERDPAALRKIATLRETIVGGEEMNPQMVAKLQALLPVGVTNGYGPTEASIGMVFHTVSPEDGDAVPLGRPIDNCYAVIVDDERRPMPRGAVGEIAIGGVCLGSGYFGDPARTAELFVPNPFAEIPGARLYRTGDLGHFDERGRLWFLGRKDFQVKIGGVRIELGELETVAESCPHVSTAKVLVTQRERHKSLAVFASGDDELTEGALREHMRRALPRTSLPRHYFVLSEMPLTDNGKVDRRALQTLLDGTIARHAVALRGADVPALALDRVLHTFRAVLHAPALAAGDDFIEAGGDSMQALAAVQRLREAFGVALGAQDLFDNPTATAMCRLIEAKLAGPHPATDDEDESVLMARDALVPPSLALAPADRARRLETVLVTGATGFVGSRIVHELLVRTALRVVCVCRAPSDTAARLRAIEALVDKGLWQHQFAARLEVYAGDLARERVGLSAAVWDKLAERCDLIVHNGALVNFLFDYRAHRGPNVLGTHELLRLATERAPKPLHYVSTLGVVDSEAALRAEPLPETFDPADAVPPSSGYSRSKWVAERCLLAARRGGATVTIVRLGEVMPAADNGHPNPHALTHFLLAAFHRLGAVPDVPLRSDFTPVDHAAARVVASVVDPQAWGETLHAFDPRSVAFDELLAGGGTPLARVPCGEFLARLERAVAADPERELVTLRALLPRGQDEGALRAAFGRLLVDNPRLFRNDVCRRFEARWGLEDARLGEAIEAYRGYLARSAAPAYAPAATTISSSGR
jgi:amino acid adenylation domain-containing protein/thioester reductase-like protein